MAYNLKRLAGYLLGFVLFYAPFALFQRVLGYALTDVHQLQTIHSLCLRIPLEHVLDGRVFRYASISVVSTAILLVAAFILGPVFCGRLCPAGAFTELLSSLVPERFKISWRSYTEIAPIRYGMLAGFCLVPFFDGILACTYCNFFLFDLLANYFTRGYFISLTSSLIFTAFMWIVVFGLFTKGGRGFCNFLCPVGAAQSLVYAVSCKLGLSWRMQVDKSKCVGCGVCAKKCPMEAATVIEKKADIACHNCIVCGVCAHNCPMKAISYRRCYHEE